MNKEQFFLYATFNLLFIMGLLSSNWIPLLVFNVCFWFSFGLFKFVNGAYKE